MAATFLPIDTETGWADLVVRSAVEPVLLFKHDPYCIVSIYAHRQMSRLDREVPVLDVAAEDALSQQVAADTGVRHESPQVVVLRNGKAAWSASHHRITRDSVEAALADAEHSGPAGT